jgi:hypothetical protein
VRLLIAFLIAAVALPLAAEPLLSERERAVLALQQKQREELLARARARCLEQRGVDCDSEQGLQEWILLEQSRQQYLLERYGIQVPQVPSAGAGATAR